MVFRICLCSLLISRGGSILCEAIGFNGVLRPMLLSLLSTMLPLLIWHRKSPPSPSSSPKEAFDHLLTWVIVGSVMLIGLNIIFSWFFPSPPSPIDSSYMPTLPVILAYVAIPAIGEELLYRGLLWKLIAPGGREVLLIVTSFCFAIGHRGIGQICFAMTAGLVLGLIRMHSHVSTCIFIHAIHNYAALRLASSTILEPWFWVFFCSAIVWFCLAQFVAYTPSPIGNPEMSKKDIPFFLLFLAAALILGAF